MSSSKPKTYKNNLKGTENVQQFAASKKVYLSGSREDIRVPMREISQTSSKTETGEKENPSILVYDTSGPYTDLSDNIDLTVGLKPHRLSWVLEREDTEELTERSSIFAKNQSE